MNLPKTPDRSPDRLIVGGEGLASMDPRYVATLIRTLSSMGLETELEYDNHIDQANIVTDGPLMLAFQEGGPKEHVIAYEDIEKCADQHSEFGTAKTRLYNGLLRSSTLNKDAVTSQPIIAAKLEDNYYFSYRQLVELTQPNPNNPQQQPFVTRYANIGAKTVELLELVLEQKTAEIEAAQ